jgi:chromosome segregation ATPase
MNAFDTQVLDAIALLRAKLSDTNLSLACAQHTILETTKERDYAQEQFHAARRRVEQLQALLNDYSPGGTTMSDLRKELAAARAEAEILKEGLERVAGTKASAEYLRTLARETLYGCRAESAGPKKI